MAVDLGGRIDPELRELIVRLARENPRWGAVRIVGELRALGFEVSARTVRRYRDGAHRRSPSQSWRTFLRNHRPEIWAVDLFTVQTIAMRTLYVEVFISHERRRVERFDGTRHPTAAWLWLASQARFGSAHPAAMLNAVRTAAAPGRLRYRGRPLAMCR